MKVRVQVKVKVKVEVKEGEGESEGEDGTADCAQRLNMAMMISGLRSND